MSDANRRSNPSADLVERALTLIQNGRSRQIRFRKPKLGPLSSWDSTSQRQQHLIERDARIEVTLDNYFRSLKSADVIGAIQQLEAGDDVTEIQHATKVLAAFFRWAAMSVESRTHDSQPIEKLAARFAVAVSCRLAGSMLDSDRVVRPVHPEWQSPDIALGWRSLKYRPLNRYEEPRAAGIIAMWVKLAIDDVSPGDREIRIGTAFGVGRSTIRKTLADWPEYRRLFESQTLKQGHPGTKASDPPTTDEADTRLMLDACIREGLAYSKIVQKSRPYFFGQLMTNLWNPVHSQGFKSWPSVTLQR